MKKTSAFASACILEPLSIGKTADLIWERKGGSKSDALSLQDLEMCAAGFELSARPAAVCFLSLPTSVNAYSGEDVIVVTGFTTSREQNVVINNDGSYSFAVQASPVMIGAQLRKHFTGVFEVCLAYN
jgi:hypothetical protein